MTDSADDIIINGDITIEPGTIVSTIKIAERRISARYDDFLINNIGAGLERHILKRIDAATKYNIEDDIRRSLTSDMLMSFSEYKAYLLSETDDGSLPIVIKFTSPYFGSEYTFSTLINNQNQRSYN